MFFNSFSVAEEELLVLPIMFPLPQTPLHVAGMMAGAEQGSSVQS